MKLDELIIYTEGADNELVELEHLSDEQMDRLEKHYHRLARVLGKSNGSPANAPMRQTPRSAAKRPARARRSA
jgi:low affinity Fe/Cu permease